MRPAVVTGMLCAVRATFATGMLGTALCALTGCAELPPNGEIVVRLATDAPLPRQDANRFEDPIPLFDRLRVEIFQPGELEPCEACVRDFDARHEEFEKGSMSFSVTADPGTEGIRVRTRLFWSVGTIETGQPVAGSTIDVLAEVPPIPEDRVEELTLVLPLDATGKPSTPNGPAAALSEEPPPANLTGSHWAVQRTACTSAPRPEEACVPGGAFWMRRPFGTVIDRGPAEHQLTVLSPFFVWRTEVTVGEVRKIGLPASLYTAWSGSDAALLWEDDCTYADDGTRDALPMNCVKPVGASLACEALGGALPSSAQLDYLAGGLQNRSYPWGDELPSCEDAVWGRDWADGAPCLNYVEPGHVLPPGSGLRDRIDLPSGDAIVDIAGNLGEIARDLWIPWSAGGCWGERFGQTIAVDPVCLTGALSIFQHGTWLARDQALLASGSRLDFADEAFLRDGGFRCTRPDGPPPSP